MKRELNAPNFGFAQGLSRFTELQRPYAVVNCVDNSELNRLLSLVFSADEFGSIQGDLGILLSEKVDPAIVNFVKQQLLFDTTPAQQAPLPTFISDDDAIEMRRNLNETSDEYAERLAKKMLSIKDTLKQQKDS